MAKEAFRIIDCSECGEEFNIAVTNICPECKSINSLPVESDSTNSGKKKSPFRAFTPPRVVSMEERLETIEYLLQKIQRDVSFFSRALLISLIVGYFWVINKFN